MKRLGLFIILTLLFGCDKGEDTVGLHENLQKAEAFLAKNANKKNITTTDSGLQYEILTSGDGATPQLDSTVVTHYAGKLLDGTEFDSSYDREPLSFAVTGVIAGWTEALQLMQVGDKWRLYVHPKLAYGERGIGPIPGNSALIFDIELLEVK